MSARYTATLDGLGRPTLSKRPAIVEAVLKATNQCALDNRRMSALSCRPSSGQRLSASHNPAPWGKGRSTGGATIFGADGKAIAEVHSGPHAIGNIALIAAAPDLLAALVEMASNTSNYGRTKALAAIAKATGSAS